MCFPSHWVLSHFTIVETTDAVREMIPVAMTIINPWKEYWPPVLKSTRLPTEQWGSVTNNWKEPLKLCNLSLRICKTDYLPSRFDLTPEPVCVEDIQFTRGR